VQLAYDVECPRPNRLSDIVVLKERFQALSRTIGQLNDQNHVPVVRRHNPAIWYAIDQDAARSLLRQTHVSRLLCAKAFERQLALNIKATGKVSKRFWGNLGGCNPPLDTGFPAGDTTFVASRLASGPPQTGARQQS
jgi:hypothetical protein